MQTHVEIETADGVCDATVTLPDGDGSFPAILFYMDGIGVRPVLHHMAERMAAAGYVVLLPNMFYRDGRAPVFDYATILQPENRPKLMEMVMSVTPARVVSDAKAFLDFLAAHKKVRPGSKVGTTGYCMGGAMVMRTAAHFPDRVAAGGAFHAGGLVNDQAESPHLLASKIKAEMYFGHADQDPYMTADQIAALNGALKTAGVKFTAELYTGALHGYTMPDLPAYNADACERHWQALMALFARTLK
jgi:carboxymethylenebutenolidase